MKKIFALAVATAGLIAAPVLTQGALAQTTIITPGATMETTTPGATIGTTVVPGATVVPGTTVGTAPANGIDMTIGVLQSLDARDFVREAASSDVFEQESSQMALDKSTREDVRTFARQMVSDHTATTRQLATIAGAQGIGLPMRPGITHQEKLDRLQALSGASFDQQYVMDQVMAHRDAIRLFQTVVVSNRADMAPFQAFAAQSLPALRQHLQHAEALAGMGTPTARQ